MKLLLALYLLVSYLSLQVTSTTGVDINTLVASSAFTCLKNNKISFAIVSALTSNGNLDPNANINLQNARAAKINTDIYITPCRGKDPINQVNLVLAGIQQKYFNTIWIDVETSQGSSCAWESYSQASNCEYLNELMDQIINSFKTAGVYTSSSMWQQIFGTEGCRYVAEKSLLWYAYYNNVQSFNDYKPFGGWSQPSMKQQFGNFKLCDTQLNRDWLP